VTDNPTAGNPATPTFGPYSPVRRAGSTYYTAGQVGVDPATGTAAGDVTTQTKQALENLKTVLAGVSLGMDDVVKTNIYVADMADFAAVNQVYVDYFAEPRPARSTVAVKELPRVGNGVPILVEIDAVAHKESASESAETGAA